MNIINKGKVFAADDEISEIENFLESENSKSKSQFEKQNSKKTSRNKIDDTIKKLSSSSLNSSFENIAVIQPKFSGKTKRFEISLGATTQVNDAFFSNLGGSLHLTYYFSEKWGLDINGVFLSNSQRKVTDSLATRGVVTTTIITPKSYYGLSLKWVPVYGKMSYLDDRIIPFDLYFSLGGGITNTNQVSSNSSAPTIQVSTGQTFSLSRKIAFRWDLSWNSYKPESSTTSGTFSNILLNVGVSYFFPNNQNERVKR